MFRSRVREGEEVTGFAVCKYLPYAIDFFNEKNLFNLAGKNVTVFSSGKQTLDKFKLEIRHTF